MSLACTTYTELMSRLAHGYPLWEPEPTKHGEVLVGDVGYFLDGGFYRLFNATLAPEHEVNKANGVPDGYQPFVFHDSLLHRRSNALDPGPLCSKSVVALQAEASVTVGSGAPQASGGLCFKCTDEHGAILVLEREATREKLHPSKDLKHYIVHNHASWHRFAQDTLGLDVDYSKIVFVSGWVKTSRWAMASAMNCTREGEIVFGGSFGAVAGASFTVSAKTEKSMSVEQRVGPRRSSEGNTALLEDQCIFIHFHKLKRRLVRGPKVIRAAGSRSGTPSDTCSDDMGHERQNDEQAEGALSGTQDELLEVGTHEVETRQQIHDPIDDVLDYILKNSEAQHAVSSHDDLRAILSISGENTLPDDLPRFLRDSGIPLEVTSQNVGVLSMQDVQMEPMRQKVPCVAVDVTMSPSSIIKRTARPWHKLSPTPSRSRSRRRSRTPGCAESSACNARGKTPPMSPISESFSMPRTPRRVPPRRRGRKKTKNAQLMPTSKEEEGCVDKGKKRDKDDDDDEDKNEDGDEERGRPKKRQKKE